MIEKIKIYFERECKPGAKPREVAASICKSDRANTITVSETFFGERGGKFFHQVIVLSLDDWEKIILAYQKQREGL